ncbi:sugar kinase [[Clostridium] colinum]|uniref:sugar kinase n=1 Tax=[Clostridium] colinum TaxID=36835 RepID=UPI00202577AD|nr:sugar kinase [[Clostridium] colinum]
MTKTNLDTKSILGFGEIMLRLTPPNNQRIIQANSFEALYSGGEANVIISLSLLGHKTKFLTKLPNNYLGDKVINNLRGYNIDTNDILQCEGRLGVYYAEMGYGLRSTEVIYDRKYSAISMANKEDFNLEKILENVSLVHLSGITPALSENLKEIVINMVKYCAKKGIKVSYDSNYRAKLWSLQEAKEVLEEILPHIDYCFLGYLDMVNILNFEVKNNSLDFDTNLKDLYKELLKKYPNLKYVASTKRVLNTVNNNTLEGYLFNGTDLFKSKTYTFDILDRVGAGDAFTAGILHGILSKKEDEKTVEFGTCASVLKHSITGDINVIDEEAINSLVNDGLKTVKR